MFLKELRVGLNLEGSYLILREKKCFGNVIQNTLGKKTCGNIAKFLIALRVNTKGNTAKYM